MVRETFVVKDPDGLHARPAAIITKLASLYDGEIYIIYKDEKYTLKSLMIVLNLAIPHQASFTIELNGPNEDQTIREFKSVLQTNGIV